jgi:hypothetical protein
MAEITKPIYQTIFHPEKGDCCRAAIATLFNLEAEQVPHFMLFGVPEWGKVLSGFIWSMGYDFIDNGDPNKSLKIEDHQTINGITEAAVKSKNFPGKFHSVLINTKGVVVHDPHPRKDYLGINVFESGDIDSWMIFKKHD